MEHDELIEKIRRLPEQVAELVAGLSADQLTARPLAGEWSVAQNVHHLCDSHMNSYVRCKLIASEHQPPLKPYLQDVWAEFADASGPDLGDSLALLRGMHGRWVLFWKNLPPEAWARSGMHPENGEMSLDRILGVYAAHGEAHLNQITGTIAALEH
jgi:hypothetical protein